MIRERSELKEQVKEGRKGAKKKTDGGKAQGGKKSKESK